MCYFMFAITKKEILPKVIERSFENNLFIRDYSEFVKDSKKGYYYYDISNGHCVCDIVISPFDKVEEVKNVLQEINKDGDFRFLIINSDEEDVYMLQEHNQNIEKLLDNLPQKTVSIEQLLDIYPQVIDFDIVYNVE